MTSSVHLFPWGRCGFRATDGTDYKSLTVVQIQTLRCAQGVCVEFCFANIAQHMSKPSDFDGVRESAGNFVIFPAYPDTVMRLPRGGGSAG